MQNPQYSDEFAYFSADNPDRADYIIDDDEDESNDFMQSDLVRIILNLAYLPEERAKSFKMDKVSYMELVKNSTTIQ